MICVGKAGQDIFLQGEVFKPKRENGILYEHMALGNKYEVENATTATGNNAVNAAVTFARQRLPVRLVSSVGKDIPGRSVLEALDAEHVDTSAVRIDSKARTSFSTILLAPSGERTILDYHGSATIEEAQLNECLDGVSWLYVSSLGSMKLLKKLLKKASDRGVKVAFNPASYELGNLQECADLLPLVTVFALNKEEARLFSEEKDASSLARDLAQSVDIVLVSDGPKGAVACDGEKLIKAGMYKDVPVVDRTGAGDAFTSGFVSQIAQGKNLEHAITFASANSTSVVTQIGANTGALHSNFELKPMKLEITDLR